MKKITYLALGALLAAGMSGCNMGWPSLFCNSRSSDCVSYESCDPCGGCESYYAPSGFETGYMPSMETMQMMPSQGQMVPVPGPAST